MWENSLDHLSFCRLDNRLCPIALFLFTPVFCFCILKFKFISVQSLFVIAYYDPKSSSNFLMKRFIFTSLLPSFSVTSALTQKICYTPLNYDTYLTLLPEGTILLSNSQGLFIVLGICPTFHTQQIRFAVSGAFSVSKLHPFL